MHNSRTRKRIRLKDYDYSENGYYFVTVCTDNRQELFGTIEGPRIVLNDAGKMIQFWWSEIPTHFKEIALDRYVIMPDHIHGIIIVGADRRVRPIQMRHTYDVPSIHTGYIPNDEKYNDITINCGDATNTGRTHRSAPTVSGIMQWFKTMTTNKYIHHVKTDNWKPFRKRLRQRSFHDHIIRNDRSLNAIRKYIAENPVNGEQDKQGGCI